MESWIEIKGYEDIYLVSNLGQIKSIDRKMEYIHHNSGKICFRKLKGKLLKITINKKNGYCAITLHKDNNVKTLYIHRLVSEAFLFNLDNKPEVNHINGIKTDNRIQNLEWVTSKENGSHSSINNLISKGDKHYKSVLSNSQVDDARKSNLTIKQLSIKYGVEYRSMWQIIRGITR